jgi:cytochrome b involved in lipid metabolism
MKKIIAIILGVIFVVGASIIVYRGRPVMKLKNIEEAKSEGQTPENNAQPAVEAVSTALDLRVKQGFIENEKEVEVENDEVKAAVSAPTPTVDSSVTKPVVKSTENMFSMTEVQAHKTPADCWSAINGLVYDLTTWINRHPGGTKPIESLCGTDGSARFVKKHGGASAPQAALVLLKIGTLK